MFLAGLKLALGLVAGLILLSGVAMLGIIGAELFDRWRKKRRRLQWEVKARALRRVTPQFRERAVFCFCFRTDDWIRSRKETKYPR